VQCLSGQIRCWTTAGTVFATLPPECHGGTATTSLSGGDGGTQGNQCPGSVIIVAADGSMSLATVRRSLHSFP
jgi:hypothetical protein